MHEVGSVVSRHDLDVGRRARGVNGEGAPARRMGIAAQDVPFEEATATNKRHECSASVGVRR
eukprot:5665025-Pleurochrysis_carterae.AAC.1